MHSIEYLLVLVRAGDGQHAWVSAGNVFGLGPKAAGYDHAAIFGQRLANGSEALGLGAIQKATGVHNHRVRARVIRRDCITLGAQTSQDALAIHQGFGATKADHTNFGLARTGGFRHRCAGEIRAEVWWVCAHGTAIAQVAAGRNRKSVAKRRAVGLFERATEIIAQNTMYPRPIPAANAIALQSPVFVKRQRKKAD